MCEKRWKRGQLNLKEVKEVGSRQQKQNVGYLKSEYRYVIVKDEQVGAVVG